MSQTGESERINRDKEKKKIPEEMKTTKALFLSAL